MRQNNKIYAILVHVSLDEVSHLCKIWQCFRNNVQKEYWYPKRNTHCGSIRSVGTVNIQNKAAPYGTTSPIMTWYFQLLITNCSLIWRERFYIRSFPQTQQAIEKDTNVKVWIIHWSMWDKEILPKRHKNPWRQSFRGSWKLPFQTYLINAKRLWHLQWRAGIGLRTWTPNRQSQQVAEDKVGVNRTQAVAP